MSQCEVCLVVAKKYHITSANGLSSRVVGRGVTIGLLFGGGNHRLHGQDPGWVTPWWGLIFAEAPFGHSETKTRKNVSQSFWTCTRSSFDEHDLFLVLHSVISQGTPIPKQVGVSFLSLSLLCLEMVSLMNSPSVR